MTSPSQFAVPRVSPNSTVAVTPLDTAMAPIVDHDTAEIRRIINDFLTRCDIRLERRPFDVDFYNECKEILISDYLCCTHEVPTILDSWCKRYLNAAVFFATTAYGHLNSKATKVYITIYTALLLHCDDVFETNVEHFGGFSERLIKGEPQGDLFLDALAKSLSERSRYYGRFASNTIITAALRYFTGMYVELQTHNMKFHEELHNFALFCRDLSGAADSYSVFIFPQDIPFDVYVKCLPDLSIYINYSNDVMSFYKEDRAGETDNFVSILRQIHPSMTKYQILQKIVDDILEADLRVRKVLAEYQPALDAYEHFRKGFVAFHVSSRRYRLDELFSYDSFE